MSAPATSVCAVEQLRSLALVGQAAAGKTSLAEAVLVAAGALAAPGALERGTTVSDFDPLERAAQHSLATACMHVHHGGCRVHLLDTPGYADFLGQAMTALEAVDTAAVVVSAVTGVEAMSVRMMHWAAERGLDRLVIVNKIDAAGADPAGVLEQLRAAFGRECLPLNLPAGGGTRVSDCFFAREGEADFASVAQAHQALVEQVVEVDPLFVERYLNEGDVDPRELHAPLEQALREGHLIPVCFVSARTGAGVPELLDIIERLLPHPGEANPPQFLKGEGAQAAPMRAVPDPARHVLAHVFKVAQDPYVGKLGILRVHQGTITPGGQLYVGDGRKPFKVGHLFMLQGKERVEVAQAVPGDICAVAKVDELRFDAVLHDAAEDDHLHLKPLALPVAVHGLAIAPKRRGDEQRIWDALQKLVDEDPCLRIEQVPQTHETVVYGLGELHLRTLLQRLAQQYHVEVETRAPRIAYRETITVPAEGHHRHKKQTGGAGQFGEVFLKIEPLPRGAGFEFVDAVKGGTIPGVFMPAVEKGVRQAMEAGVISGHPVVDVRVVVYEGKHHPVDSKEVAFVAAGRKAFIDAMRKAVPQVLEPIVGLEINVPDAHVGDVTGDLASRRGVVNGTQSGAPGSLTVLALAPQAELMAYQMRLHALTGGQGSYTLALSHYDVVPPTVQQHLVANYQLKDED